MHEALSAVGGLTHSRPPDHRLTLRVDRPSTPSPRATTDTDENTTDTQKEVTFPTSFPSHRKNGSRRLGFVTPLPPPGYFCQPRPAHKMARRGTQLASSPVARPPSRPRPRCQATPRNGVAKEVRKGGRYHCLVITTTHQILTLHVVSRRPVRAPRRGIMPN